MRPTHWKCWNCSQMKEAHHFASFDLHSKCDACRRIASGKPAVAGDAPAGADNRAVVPARRKGLKTPRPGKTWGND